MFVLRDDKSQYLSYKAPLPIIKSDSTDTIVFYAKASEHFMVLHDRGATLCVQSGMSCVKAAFQAQELPLQDPGCCLPVRVLQAPCSGFAFSSLQQLEPLRIYLPGGLLGSWTLSDIAQGCASLCGRGITEMIVLLQKLNCFVKEKLNKTRAETYATHLTHSLFDAKRSKDDTLFTSFSVFSV